jgi:dipeptidyl aminopeptidase/acylaminoacyl peptidase
VRIIPLLVASLTIAALTFPTNAGAQGSAPTLLTNYAGVAIAPSGEFVADVESLESPDPAKDVAQHLFVRTIATAAAREIPLSCAGIDGCSVTVPVWSHDGKSIAYVVHAPKSPTREIYVASVSRGTIAPALLLSFTGTVGSLKFSRDDTKLAMLAIPNARKEVGATQAGAAIVGEIGADIDEQRIAVVPLAKPAIAYASPSDLFVYEYDWMPDGAGFVGTAAHGDGDNNWWIARLYRFDASTSLATEIYRPSSPQQQLASPRVSPDGKYVAFIAGIMSDFGSTGGDLYRLSLEEPGATPVDFAIDDRASITSFIWDCRKDDVFFTSLAGADSELSLATAGAGKWATRFYSRSSAETSYAGDGVNVSRGCDESTTPRGGESLRYTLAAVRQSYEKPPEIDVYLPGKDGWVALTHANADIPAEAAARSVAWKSDGFSVQGWLLEPKTLPPGGKRALITVVHGGPAAANVPRFIGRGALRDLLHRGYAVFLPNPRGSFGQGEAFTRANVKDFGYGDLRDILAGIDAVEKLDPAIDDKELGITGGSYGGFMTMWAVTQTDRFKAAVAGAGVSDWISYYGENGIDEWMIPYFGASAYDDPAVYRKSSPIEFITHVKTPTFEYVGERDVECPAPQSQEFWHALVAEGVPTSRVIYAGEGHGIRSAANVADVSKRTLAWFDRYLHP